MFDLILIVKAFVLGIVEGITEFIPVSSTGHLIVAGDLLGFNDDRAKTFEVFIQLGAILSVLYLYRVKIGGALLHVNRDKTAQRFVVNLLIAFLPAAGIGFLTHHWIKEYLFTPITVAAALIVGGIAILLIERAGIQSRVHDVDVLSYKTALAIGCAQVLALFPGVSRSGATIMGGLVAGLDRKTATEFSFFLAIPTMFAATLFDLAKGMDSLHLEDAGLFAVGFITSFVSALVVIKAFIGFVSNHDFKSFAYYRIVFGAIVLIFYA
jgi:undecaprenyl-diphosphatase